MSIQSEINSLQTYTAKAQAAQEKASGSTGSSELDQDAFLKLMLIQLQNQDPMDPMDSQEFLSQQATYTQLSEVQQINDAITANNQIMQATSMVGKEVTIQNPNNSNETITGKVDSANFTSSNATITIGGQEYPLSLVMSVAGESTTTK